MTNVPVSSKLTLPPETVTRRTAILAKTGAGKSNTAKVIVEGCLNLGAQVVILDPVGHWWGLRSLFAIPVLGGSSGDLPLDPLSGKLMARVVVESGQSLVLDVSGMDSDGQMQRFAKDFAKTLYDLKKTHPSAILLVLEEADEFAPQDTRGAHVPEMVGAFVRIAKRGRGFGIGLLSVTLRSAGLSKNVLNQSDTVIAMRTTAPLDIKAIKEWLEYVELADGPAILRSLPQLVTGSAWFVTPEDGVVVEVKVTKAKSLDTSATPKVGDVPVDVRKRMKPINLAALGEEMAAVADRVRQEDPAELHKRIAELERQLAARPTETRTVEVPVEVEVVERVTVLPEPLTRFLREHARVLSELSSDFEQGLGVEVERALPEPERGVVRHATLTDAGAAGGEQVPGTERSRGKVASPVQGRRPPARSPAPVSVNGDGPKLKAGARRIVEVLAGFHPMPMTRSQIATHAKLKKTGGTFGSYWSAVKVAGLIEEGVDGRTVLTEAGLEYVGGVPEPMTPAELLDMWRDRLKAGARAMLEALVETHPEWWTRVDLAARVGLEPTGGTFGSYLSTLRVAGLIEENGQDLRAAEVLFLGARA